jgi:XTP/dITP diphosphohydrolase
MTIVLATHNKHKVDELQAVLHAELSAISVLSLDAIPNAAREIDETGSTLEENALIKARAVYAVSKLPTIADDTGLEVDALGGAPGVYSARYAGENATYEDNWQKLLNALEHADSRRANFATVIAYIDSDGQEHLFRGEVKGMITEAPRGTAGFGYDPIFQPVEDIRSRTFAEMNADEKHAISHRGRATRAFIAYLRSLAE